jgi:PAS domain S-box-containing protein
LTWGGIAPGEHFVHFFEKDAFLVDSLRGFIGEGLGRDEPALVILTPEHLAALEDRLAADGIDLAAARSRGRYRALDAADTLSLFMAGDRPDPARFRRVMGEVLRPMVPPGGGCVRAFGEMVALLWADGRKQGAIELEELWNDLATSFRFTLYCAYPMSLFASADEAEKFGHVCTRHTRVIPAESYSGLAESDARLREVSALQQRAAALEAEVRARRDAEEKLKKRERELADLLDNAPEGIHRVGPGGIVLWANRAHLSTLGYEPSEYIGHNAAEFYEDRAALRDMLDRLTRGETIHNAPARMRHRDGTMRDVLVHSNGLFENGEFRYTRCFIRDITEQKRAQDERDALLAREHATRLELELANNDLRDFAYIVAHDLREPLRGIGNSTGFLEIDHGEALGPGGRERVNTIKRLTRRCYDLLDGIMAFARIGREGVLVEPVAVSDLFGDALEMLRSMIEAEHAQVTCEPCTPEVRCDRTLAVQVLTNLISNGLKYNRSEPKRVRIACESRGPSTVVSVRDNGIGIDPRHTENIFKMFKRLHAAGEYGGGTGAGLAIARRIVERHGGRMWLESTPGAGSTFYFTLAPSLSPG